MLVFVSIQGLKPDSFFMLRVFTGRLPEPHVAGHQDKDPGDGAGAPDQHPPQGHLPKLGAQTNIGLLIEYSLN